MNGSSSNSSLPSGSFLSDAFVVFSQKVGEGHFWRVQDRYIRPRTVMDVLFNRGRAKARKAAGAQMPRARDHFADFLHSLAARFFFSLGFKFSCIVLRVAYALALIMDLWRHYYLQLRL